MNTCTTELLIDLGQVGYRGEGKRFAVRLSAKPLATLVSDANNAYRVYELMLVTRPGDVWQYIEVIPESLPESVASRVEDAKQKVAPRTRWKEHPWRDGAIPFNDFDRIFYWAHDDTAPEDEAWLWHRQSKEMRSYADYLFAIAKNAQSCICWNDSLLEHVVRQIHVGKHPFDRLERQSAIREARSHQPAAPRATEAFYEKLQALLSDQELVSVAYRGRGDVRILRALATEQRRRASVTGHEGDAALAINASVSNEINNEAWCSTIHFYMEGLGSGDLFVQETGSGGCSVKLLIEEHHRIAPGRGILSFRDEGDIAGFEKDSGDGWFHYRPVTPVLRPQALSRCEHLRTLLLFMFDASGEGIFAHEKGVIIAGEDVSKDLCLTVAKAVRRWQDFGSSPLVVSLGDGSHFIEKGCVDVVSPPSPNGSGQDDIHAEALLALIRARSSWIDVLILLDAPEWVVQVLDELLWVRNRVWNTRILTTKPLDRVPTGTMVQTISHSEFLQAYESALAQQR